MNVYFFSEKTHRYHPNELRPTPNLVGLNRLMYKIQMIYVRSFVLIKHSLFLLIFKYNSGNIYMFIKPYTIIFKKSDVSCTSGHLIRLRNKIII